MTSLLHCQPLVWSHNSLQVPGCHWTGCQILIPWVDRVLRLLSNVYVGLLLESFQLSDDFTSLTISAPLLALCSVFFPYSRVMCWQREIIFSCWVPTCHIYGSVCGLDPLHPTRNALVLTVTAWTLLIICVCRQPHISTLSYVRSPTICTQILGLEKAKLLHGEQYLSINAPIPTSGELVNDARLVLDSANKTLFRYPIVVELYNKPLFLGIGYLKSSTRERQPLSPWLSKQETNPLET